MICKSEHLRPLGKGVQAHEVRPCLKVVAKMLFFIGIHLIFCLWFPYLLLSALTLVWLFRVLGFWVLRLPLRAVPFCPRCRVFRVRSVLAVLRVLTASFVRLFRRLWCFGFSPLLLVRLLPCARLVWFVGALRVRVCLLRFLWVLVLLALLFLRLFVVAVRVLGVLLLWLLA